MTTTPAMPELPEPELGYIETDKSRQPAFSARQMRAAMQAQPAAVSDEQILTEAARHLGEMHIENCGLGDIKAFARAIIALRPQAVPMTELDVALALSTQPMMVDIACAKASEVMALVRAVESHHFGITQRADGGEG
ncbi:MAG: hypothetical protein IIA02_10550 [Proteobacteria bacterium]|nr:hypothetical protein [Pseudomonadota bacterium]